MLLISKLFGWVSARLSWVARIDHLHLDLEAEILAGLIGDLLDAGIGATDVNQRYVLDVLCPDRREAGHCPRSDRGPRAERSPFEQAPARQARLIPTDCFARHPTTPVLATRTPSAVSIQNTNARGRPVPRPNWVLQTSYRSHLPRQPEGMRRFSTQFGGIAPRNKRGMPEFWSIALSCCSEIDLYRQWLTVLTRPAATPGPRPRDLAHSPDRRSSRRRGLHPLVRGCPSRRSLGIHLEVSAFHLPR